MHLESYCWRIILGDREVCEWRGHFPNVIDHRVSNDPDNFTQGRIAKEMKPLADGFLVRPEVFGHRLVDDHDRSRRLPVGIAEHPPLQQRNAKRIEKSRSDIVELCQRPAIPGCFILSLGKNCSCKTTAERKV